MCVRRWRRIHTVHNVPLVPTFLEAPTLLVEKQPRGQRCASVRTTFPLWGEVIRMVESLRHCRWMRGSYNLTPRMFKFPRSLKWSFENCSSHRTYCMCSSLSSSSSRSSPSCNRTSTTCMQLASEWDVYCYRRVSETCIANVLNTLSQLIPIQFSQLRTVLWCILHTVLYFIDGCVLTSW